MTLPKEEVLKNHPKEGGVLIARRLTQFIIVPQFEPMSHTVRGLSS